MATAAREEGSVYDLLNELRSPSGCWSSNARKSANFYQSLDEIQKISLVEPADRSEEQINAIVDFVKDCKLISALGRRQQRKICQAMTREHFKAKDFIFQQGDPGGKYYTVIKGSVRVDIAAATGGHSGGGGHVHKAGSGFGEMALQSGQPHADFAQAEEDSVCFVITRSVYEWHAGQMPKHHIEQRVKFLRQFPRVEEALQRCLVSTQDIAMMANCLTEHTLCSDEVIVEQGALAENMIFVRNGSLAMLRLVDLDNLCEADGSPCEFFPPTAGPPQQKDEPPSPVSPDASPGGRNRRTSMLQSLAHLHNPHFVALLAAALLGARADQALTKKSAPKKEGIHNLLAAAAYAIMPAAHAAFLVFGEFEGAELSNIRRTMLPRSSTRKSKLGHSAADHAKSRSHELWMRLRAGLWTACLQNRLQRFRSSPRQAVVYEGEAQVEHFMEVAAARRRYLEHQTSELAQQRMKRLALLHEGGGRPRPTRKTLHQGRGSKLIHVDSGDLASQAESGVGEPALRQKLLRIGTLGVTQYFGDREISEGLVYPLSLVSDPFADVYVLHKHDIKRRLSEKLFMALFRPEKELLPSDVQVLEMHQQEKRWSSFRRSLHEDAVIHSKHTPRSFRPRPEGMSSLRLDVRANLEFLGIKAETLPQIVPRSRPSRREQRLLPKDEVLFSQSSSVFLRSVNAMRQDPDLRKIAAQGTGDYGDDPDDFDPSCFVFERNWAKLGPKLSKQIMGLVDEETLDLCKVRGRRSSSVGAGGVVTNLSPTQALGRRSSVFFDEVKKIPE